MTGQPAAAFLSLKYKEVGLFPGLFYGSTIFGTDGSKILLVPFLLITVLYVQKKKTADPRSSVTKERTVFNE